MTNTELIAEARRYAPTFTDDERGYDSELVGRLTVALAQSERDLVEARAAAQTFDRESLIARASVWAGWCTDHDSEMPDLAKLAGILLDVTHQMALDRPTTVAPKEGRS